MFGLFDPVYWLFIGPAALLGLWAQMKVKSAYGKWSRVGASARLTGAQAADRMLRHAGVNDVRIEMTQGFLSDHYDPRSRTLRLSRGNYEGASVAAMGIACHEAGHALQHANGYAPLAMRSAIVPVAKFGSTLGLPMLVIGMILSMKALAMVGLVLFAAMSVFHLITLPVEFDASGRAKKQLRSLGIIQSEGEAKGVAAVLDAAAMTYVAATIQSLATLLYFAMRLGLFGRRD